MFVNFSEETRHILKQAEKERDELNHPYVGSEHLFLSILKNSNLKDILKKHKITYEKFKDKLISLVGIGSKKSDFMLYTPLLKRVLENSVIEAREQNNKIVNTEIVIISILDEEDGIAYSILKSFKINFDKLYYDLKNKNTNKGFKRKKLLLDDIATNLTKMAKENKLDPVIGRKKEIQKTIEILLRRKKNNPILIGPAGVGKTAIVEAIASLIVSNDCPDYLKNKRIFSLNIFSLVSGTKYRGEFEEKMKSLIKELEENDDIILFIDEVHTVVGAGGAEGAIDASNIFKPALARGIIKIIGATTIDEYKKYIEPDQALSRRFQKIIIEEPSFDEVVDILSKIKPLYEKYHNISISNSLINQIATLTSKYLTNRYEPDRSIDILDEVCAKVSIKKNINKEKIIKLNSNLKKLILDKVEAVKNNDFKKAYELKSQENILNKEIKSIKVFKNKVNKEDILEVIKNKGNIKNIEINDFDGSYYSNLENKLKKDIIGQDENVKKIVNSLRKKNLIKDKKPYIAVIEASKGAGKNFFAKEFLENIINKNNIIKLDLSEYKEYMMISKLIGTTAGYVGYDNKNNVFEKIRMNPSSAIIIENFNKACPEVRTLFGKIAKEGVIEDSTARKIDFTNTYLIFLFDDNNTQKVGFDNIKKTNNEIPKWLINYSQVIINLNELNDYDKKILIEKEIKKIKNKYKDINIKMEDNYKECIIKNNKNISSLIYNIKKDIEDELVKTIISGNKNVYIKQEKAKIN